MENIELIATAPFGLEAAVAGEVRELGYTDVRAENGRVIFKADAEAVCRCNLWLRTADRVLLKVGEFNAVSFEELFQQVRSLPWADLLPRRAAFPVQGRSLKSQLYSVPDCQAVTKKAIVESLRETYRTEWFEEDGPLYQVEVSLWKDTATVTVDTSGPGLHKRGYRGRAVEAPLKETLAAGLILLSRWYPDTALIDPFCGSGTIPVEAALMGLNMAPGMNRSFTAEDWPQVPQKLWDQARREAKEKAVPSRGLDITGMDIDGDAVENARQNAARAGVLHAVKLLNRSFKEIKAGGEYGKIICNPPYGKRAGEEPGLEGLYREMGRIFSRLQTWSVYILTAYPHLEKAWGKKASKRRKLYNGRIEVHYYQYFGPRPRHNNL